MDKKLLAVMGLAMALPTSILAVSYVVYQLIEKKLISSGVGVTIIVAFVLNMFILMFRNLRKNKGEPSDDS